MTQSLDIQIDVFQFESLRKHNPTSVILDVRQDWEIEAASLDRAKVIVLDQLPHRLDELDPQLLLVVICHHGVRSLKAAKFLRDQGYNALSVKGGIDAYARLVDTTIPLYT